MVFMPSFPRGIFSSSFSFWCGKTSPTPFRSSPPPLPASSLLFTLSFPIIYIPLHPFCVKTSSTRSSRRRRRSTMKSDSSRFLMPSEDSWWSDSWRERAAPADDLTFSVQISPSYIMRKRAPAFFAFSVKKLPEIEMKKSRGKSFMSTGKRRFQAASWKTFKEGKVIFFSNFCKPFSRSRVIE